MVYIAKIDIGGYKTGDVVPDSLAVTWDKMYLESPVELKDSKTEVVEETEEPEVTEEVEESEEDDFANTLNGIKGIGKKTVEDIIKVYPTEADLVIALGEEYELPFRDDVAKVLKNRFGK